MKLLIKFIKWYAAWWRNYYAIKCPRCGKKGTVVTLQESAGNAFKRNFMTILFPVRLLFIKKPAARHVCRLDGGCGFSWEERK